jgi:hypothetical protein
MLLLGPLLFGYYSFRMQNKSFIWMRLAVMKFSVSYMEVEASAAQCLPFFVDIW